MFLGYVLAGYFFIRWLDNESNSYFMGACAATAASDLGQSTAAHIGLLFALLIFSKYGLAAIDKCGFGSLLSGPYYPARCGITRA